MYLSSMSLHLSGHWEHIKVASLKIALNLALCKVYVNNVLSSWYECIYIYTENTSTDSIPQMADHAILYDAVSVWNM